MNNRLPAITPADLSHSNSWRSWRELLLCSTARAREQISFEQAEKFDLLPLGLHESSLGSDVLTVAVGRHLDTTELQALTFIANAKIVRIKALPHIVSQARFAAYHSRSPLKPGEESVPRVLDLITRSAVAEDASDVHLEIINQQLRIRFRIDGALRERHFKELTTDNFENLCRHLLVLCGQDSTFQPRPVEGSFTLVYGVRRLRIRASLFLQRGGGRVVLRLLDSTPKVLGSSSRRGDLRALGMSGFQEQIMHGFLGMNSGTIVLAGPTGSGKSTLLYESLSYAQNSSRCVVTLEDPIERFIEGVSQTEVDREQGLDYRDYLKPLLRQDPDVIMVGEIRDGQTAQMALEAGITGHLVLTTIHARNVIDVLVRLGEFGISSELIALSLSHIVSQRLVPLNCPSCKQQSRLPEKLAKYLAIEDQGLCAFSSGCSSCENSGADGRIGIFESLTLSEIVKEFLLQSDKSSYPKLLSELARLGAGSLYTPRVSSVRELLISGKISPVSALRGLDIAPELFGLVDSRKNSDAKS